MFRIVYNRWLSGALAVLAVILYIYLLVFKIPFSLFVMAGICLLGLGIAIALTGFKPFFRLLFFILPLSLELKLGLGDSKIILPSEAFILILAISFVVIFLFIKSGSKNFLRHPLSILILIYALVLVITTITSQMMIVSVKFTLVNLSYICVFYYLGNLIMDQIPEKGLEPYALYGGALVLVIIYALYIHSGYGFNKNAANIVVQPFYSDHAIYSACLAMVFPAFMAFNFKGRILGLNIFSRIFSLIGLLAISCALIFSYSRAAWISLAVAAVFYMLLRLKIKPSHLFGILIIVGILLFIQREELISNSRLNRNNSTRNNPSIEEQTKSITNINSDVSNAERVNRWSCAYRMWLDRPWLGFGPGTYQFQYLGYQRPSEMTRISVMTAYNNPLGKGGSAHSEYLLALSESGIFGFLCMIGIVFLSVFYAMQAYYRSASEKEKILIMVSFCAMLTYSVHVVFNNYLNIDKTASLFWVSLSILVTICAKQKANPAPASQS